MPLREIPPNKLALNRATRGITNADLRRTNSVIVPAERSDSDSTSEADDQHYMVQTPTDTITENMSDWFERQEYLQPETMDAIATILHRRMGEHVTETLFLERIQLLENWVEFVFLDNSARMASPPSEREDTRESEDVLVNDENSE
ncbi:unnamed protein product [Kuraishia capsulata CBS 1993]|uniref:Uncharacterized protein n=1 Tax=Kuraishia capsulata CBS 1993 TaxID=1382522 RepID=W6MRF4_9ASCO|nr:uncharacterized protein KUCA_T00005277001 [Kuraishia capsulata CBS 1993]CDK29289.1 unnamed protein product [Kuraishia capsulata CBS 1993]